ncbi:unnamed protein product, partial [Musa acuminata subsp. malaccensis]
LLLQVEGEEGEDGSSDDGPNRGGGCEGSTGGAWRRGRGLSRQGGGGRGSGDEDGTGDLSHLHRWVATALAGVEEMRKIGSQRV